MAKEIYKILGQVRPAIATEEVIYTVPAKRSAIVKVTVFNNDSSLATVKIAVVPNGGADTPPAMAPENYIGDTIEIDPKRADPGAELKGITLDEFDQIRVESSNAITNFHVYGVELEP